MLDSHAKARPPDPPGLRVPWPSGSGGSLWSFTTQKAVPTTTPCCLHTCPHLLWRQLMVLDKVVVCLADHGLEMPHVLVAQQREHAP